MKRESLVLRAQLLCACFADAIVTDAHGPDAVPRLPRCSLGRQRRDHLGGDGAADGVQSHPVFMEFDVAARVDVELIFISRDHSL